MCRTEPADCPTTSKTRNAAWTISWSSLPRSFALNEASTSDRARRPRDELPRAILQAPSSPHHPQVAKSTLGVASHRREQREPHDASRSATTSEASDNAYFKSPQFLLRLIQPAPFHQGSRCGTSSFPLQAEHVADHPIHPPVRQHGGQGPVLQLSRHEHVARLRAPDFDDGANELSCGLGR